MTPHPSAADATAAPPALAALTDAPTADGDAPRPPSRWARLLFSADARRSKQLHFGLVAAGQTLAWALISAHGSWHGQIDPQAMHLLVASNLVGILGFYPWVRSGLTASLRDSGLVLPQMLWASFTAVLGFALAPMMRPALLQLLCVIQVWGFFSLRPRQLAFTGGSAALMLLAALGIGMAGGLADFELRQEVYPALLSLIVLSCITGLTIDHSVRRGRLSAGKAELNAAVAAVREMVIRDSLTGLPNRSHMQELLLAEQARALQTGRGFAVALIDLDHFKRINDSHGHPIGDTVLRRFAELAQSSIRQCDTIARWGGEEFLLLMPETSPVSTASSPLERLRTDLRQQPSTSPLARVGLTFSAGIAFHRQGEPVAHSLASADRALYAAKAAGRNQVLVAA